MSFERFSLSPVNLEATNLADEWKFWLDAFDNYRIATKLDKEEDGVQKAKITTPCWDGSPTFTLRITWREEEI